MPSAQPDPPPSAAAAGRYWRDLVAALCLKAVVLGLLYVFVLNAIPRPVVTDSVVAGHLLTPADKTAEPEVQP